MATVTQLVMPSITPCTRLIVSRIRFSPLEENPRILGNWPTMTVSAMPFR